MSAPLRIGVTGLGYWGPNLARNFAGISRSELAYCCDVSEQARARVAPLFPGTRLTGELDELLEDPTLDAIALATPVPTHAELAVRVLRAGKHCFVEKPLAQSVDDAEQAVAAAEEAGKVLMVGHLLEYHPGIAKLKELADSGELGDHIYYIYGNRLNLGKLRADENALWSLGAHDVSVVLHLAGEEPARSSRTERRMSVTASRTLSSASCASRRVCRRTCICHGLIHTRSVASRSSGRGGWRPSMTWSSSAS